VPIPDGIVPGEVTVSPLPPCHTLCCAVHLIGSFDKWGRTRMAPKPKVAFDESKLKKGELRKLTALRKSLGEDIANKAFSRWLAFNTDAVVQEVDENAELIADVLVDQINQGKLRIPRGGYLVRRGRGRVVVERAAD